MKKKESFSLTFIYLLMIAGFLCGLIISRIVDLSSVTALDSLLTTVNQNSVLMLLCFAICDWYYFYLIYFLFRYFSHRYSSHCFCIIYPRRANWFFMRIVCCYLPAKRDFGDFTALLPQVLLDIAAIVIVAVFSIECSTHLLYCTLNPMKMNAKDYVNRGLTHLLLAFVFVLIGSYLKSTLILKLIELFNLI